MILTFQQETVDFWGEQGFPAELQYEDAGYKFWAIDVPQDNKMLTSPEYLGLIVREQKNYPEMVRARFKPPMYVVTVNSRVAMTPLGIEGEPMGMPIAKDLRLLRGIFTKPDKNQQPKYYKLKRPNQIVNAMREVRQFGVQYVAYFITGDKVETFKIDTIAPLIGVNLGEVTPGDDEVSQVPSEENLHPGGTG